MFLKSLDIFGFKSFADRTHIEFADGITALLGPNGCGKSNVVDAIKWVLAENKSKNLRADKMEDVIFNGTEKRPPMGMAEVTLTIMNENGLLPLEDSEIAIMRRLYRDGEAHYFINKREVGAGEIRKLFMDTGVGKAAYSVMEQGKIDQIRSSKPEDRRYLFEEAAGISRSKAECAEAERELDRTRANLQQIEVQLGEIKRQYDTLKVQAEKTAKYRALRDDIFNDELDIQLLRLKGFTQDKARRESDLKDARQKRDEAKEQIDQINSTLSENMNKVKSMQEQMYDMQSQLIGVGAEQNGKKALQKQLTEQAGGIKEKINQLEGRKKNAQDQINDLNDEIDESDADLHEKSKQLADIAKNIDSFGESITVSAERIDQNNAAVKADEAKIAALDKERADFQTELEAITENIVTELDAKLKGAGYSSAACKKAKDELDEVLGKLKIYAAGRRNIFADYAALKSHSESDAAKCGTDAVSAFDETEKLIADVSTAIDRYTKTTPQFIDEFLSPEGIITKKRAIDAKIAANRDAVSEVQAHIEELKKTNESLSTKIDEYRETLSKLRVNQAQMQEQINAAKQQIDILRRTLASQESSLREIDDELFGENKKAEDLAGQIEEIQEALAEIEEKGRKLAESLKSMDDEIAKSNSSVSGKQAELKKKNEEMAKYQAVYEKLNADLATSDTEIRAVKDNFKETHSRDLMEFEERMYTITTPAAELREKLAASREALRLLGQPNLMAVEEFAEAKERFEKKQADYDDTKKSLENLQRVSEEIRSKSTEMFLDTYNQIRKNFHNMFRRLFNGGRGELRLIDPTNVLTTGIDIYAQPPGKKLENIALLSGGEKTMTAVALLFATYQVRPSPFCLLDEIDAALDDKNVTSFVQTLRQFGNVSQYIVITHNKKTVMGASTMLGITMEESGVSKMIALKLGEDIKIGAPLPDPEPFVEEDVEPEKGIVIPPRPPKRERTADGTVIDPEADKNRAIVEREIKAAQATPVGPEKKAGAKDTSAAAEPAGEKTDRAAAEAGSAGDAAADTGLTDHVTQADAPAADDTAAQNLFSDDKPAADDSAGGDTAHEAD